MDEVILFLKLGLNHVLEWEAYDHILFLIALTIVYTLSDWKKVAWLITLFTLGHSLTLSLSAYGILNINSKIVEFLIPLTILTTALSNIVLTKNNSNTAVNLWFSFFFGTIHGLGFSSYFKMIVDEADAKFLPLINFAIGIELAQLSIVIAILSLGYIALRYLNITSKKWIFFISVLIVIIVIPMLIERKFW